eukprot:2841307-Pyramimonas_sp.AAC.1
MPSQSSQPSQSDAARCLAWCAPKLRGHLSSRQLGSRASSYCSGRRRRGLFLALAFRSVVQLSLRSDAFEAT